MIFVQRILINVKPVGVDVTQRVNKPSVFSEPRLII